MHFIWISEIKDNSKMYSSTLNNIIHFLSFVCLIAILLPFSYAFAGDISQTAGINSSNEKIREIIINPSVNPSDLNSNGLSAPTAFFGLDSNSSMGYLGTSVIVLMIGFAWFVTKQGN